MQRLLAVVLSLVAFTVSASNRDEQDAWRRCAVQAADDFHVSLIMLDIVYAMEGGRLGHETANRNAKGIVTSYDIGPMQINTQHLPRLEALGISRQMLRDSMCINVYVATWIIRDLMDRYPRSADVLANYNSPTPAQQNKYLKRAVTVIERRMREHVGRRAVRAAGTASTP